MLFTGSSERWRSQDQGRFRPIIRRLATSFPQSGRLNSSHTHIRQPPSVARAQNHQPNIKRRRLVNNKKKNNIIRKDDDGKKYTLTSQHRKYITNSSRVSYNKIYDDNNILGKNSSKNPTLRRRRRSRLVTNETP